MATNTTNDSNSHIDDDNNDNKQKKRDPTNDFGNPPLVELQDRHVGSFCLGDPLGRSRGTDLQVGLQLQQAP